MYMTAGFVFAFILFRFHYGAFCCRCDTRSGGENGEGQTGARQADQGQGHRRHEGLYSVHTQHADANLDTKRHYYRDINKLSSTD